MLDEVSAIPVGEAGGDVGIGMMRGRGLGGGEGSKLFIKS